MRFQTTEDCFPTEDKFLPRLWLNMLSQAKYIWITTPDSGIHALFYGDPEQSCPAFKRFDSKESLNSFVKQYHSDIKEGMDRFNKEGYESEPIFEDACPHCGH